MSTCPSSAFADPVLDQPPAEAEHHLFHAHVLKLEHIGQNLLRITLGSPEFRSWSLTGPDEFFGLVMPAPRTNSPAEHTAALERLPRPEGANLRAVLNHLPEDLRPRLRWYTVRHFDAGAATLTFDVATHGAESPNEPHLGPGLRWALQAQPGDAVGVFSVHGLWNRRWQRQILIADASSLPSVFSIADYLSEFHPQQLATTHVVAVAEGAEDIEASAWRDLSDTVASATLLTEPICNQAAAAGDFVRATFAPTPANRPDYMWVAGEGGLCKRMRALALREWGLDPAAILWCPYWYIGRPRP